MKKVTGLLIMLVVGASFLCSTCFAAEAGIHTMQVEATISSSSEWLPVGDEAGHVVGMGKGEGKAVLDSGETAKYSNVFTFDTRRGKGGTSEGYTKFLFDDGASIFFYWTARITVNENGLSASSGEGTIVKGTGRFDGIEGSSVFSSRQLKSASEDPQRTTLALATLTYTFP